jgi:hypothetical protein
MGSLGYQVLTQCTDVRCASNAVLELGMSAVPSDSIGRRQKVPSRRSFSMMTSARGLLHPLCPGDLACRIHDPRTTQIGASNVIDGRIVPVRRGRSAIRLCPLPIASSVRSFASTCHAILGRLLPIRGGM